jgi:hypothetical protein
MRIFAATAVAALLSGCVTMGGTKVATDVQVLDKPIAVGCTIVWPEKPVAYVETVQLTGDLKVDLVAIERAKEAELEARIGYEQKLEAAARACATAPPPK